MRHDLKKSWVFCVLVYGGLALGLATSILSASSYDHTTTLRDPASLAFPQTEDAESSGDILRVYLPYLRFVEAVGRKTDPEATQRLASTYQTLQKRDPKGAARFLKGLRFEMTQKLEFMGANAANVNSDTPEIRRWIGRFVKVWHREADELLFRSIAMK